VLAGIVSQETIAPAARVSAAGLLLERGWGKPVQPIVGDEDQPLRVIIRHLVANTDESKMKVIEEELPQIPHKPLQRE
jgi:hypothetical protein